jgi:putative phage-type endonuclease
MTKPLIWRSKMESEQRTEEWFKQRKHRITASAVGSIMGLAPYGSRADVMRRMVREYHNAPSEFNGNAATEYGTFHEEGAIAEFCMETGLQVINAPFVQMGAFFGASPDGFVSDGRLIEVKCPYGLRNGGDFKSIDDQKHYYAQIQMQLFCTNSEECYFFQWSQHDTKTEIVKRDDSFIVYMLRECNDFYQEYKEEIKNAEKYLTDKTKKVFDEDELTSMMTEYQALKRQKEKIEERQKEILSGMVALTDDKGGSIAGHTLFKTEKAGAISYSKAIKELLPSADLEPYRGNKTEYWSIK